MTFPRLIPATITDLPCAEHLWYHLAILDFSGRTVRVTTREPLALGDRVILRRSLPLQAHGLGVEKWTLLGKENNVNLDCMTVEDLNAFIAETAHVDDFVNYAKTKRDAMLARVAGDTTTALRLEHALDRQYKDLKARGLATW